jgi:hypothetical protein
MAESLSIELVQNTSLTANNRGRPWSIVQKSKFSKGISISVTLQKLVLPSNKLAASILSRLDDVKVFSLLALGDYPFPLFDPSLLHGIDNHLLILIIQVLKENRVSDQTKDQYFGLFFLFNHFCNELLFFIETSENFLRNC